MATSARFDSLVRETLDGNTHATARLGPRAREALISSGTVIVAETIGPISASITVTVTGSVAPLSILGGVWPGLLIRRRLKRRPIAGRLEKSLPRIRCEARAVVFYAANVGARIAPIRVRATAAAGLSDDEQLVVLLLAAGLLE